MGGKFDWLNDAIVIFIGMIFPFGIDLCLILGMSCVPHFLFGCIHKTIVILPAMAFIGRERELAALGAAVQRSSQRELTRVAISGPLGIGVTRLLDELETRIAKASDLAKVSMLRAKSLEPEAGIAYAGLRTALAGGQKVRP